MIYGLLETELNLKKIILPVSCTTHTHTHSHNPYKREMSSYTQVKPKKNEPISFFFTSEDAFTNREKLMVLIHGSGVVRAGQWARR